MTPFVGGHWGAVVKESSTFAAFNRVANAVKTNDWNGTAIAPGLVCDATTAELYQIPCNHSGGDGGKRGSSGGGGGGGGGGGSSGRCNTILAGVFGYNTDGNRSTPQAILPPHPVQMTVGSVWEYQDACRQVVSAYGAKGGVACSGDSVACWKGIQNGKSKVVSCTNADVRDYGDVCGAHAPGDGGKVDFDWTCCVRKQ